MGGKGKKRREKNFRAAHGGQSRLPPPPKPSSIDALPSKLRQIMSFTKPQLQPDSEKVAVNTEQKNKGGGDRKLVDKKRRPDVEVDPEATETKVEIDDGQLSPKHTGYCDDVVEDSTHEKKKRKRKRNQVTDLRFLKEEELDGVSSKRKDRRKKRMEAMKNRHKKVKSDEDLDFPGREVVKFGDVVLAPPKLVAIPKVRKAVLDASKERLRALAIESYRSRRKWESRPGLHLPQPEITTPSLYLD